MNRSWCGRPAAALGFLALVGCTTHHGPHGFGIGAPNARARVSHACALPKPQPKSSGARWTAVVLHQWSELTWVFSSDSLSGPGTLQRFPSHAQESEEALRATGSYQPEAGVVQFRTTEGNDFVQDVHFDVRLPEGQRGAAVNVVETSKGQPHQIESVLFVNESGDFWTDLEWMHRCTTDALFAN